MGPFFLQIYCDQLRVNRLSGGASAPVLSVINFDPNQERNEYIVENHELEWREMNDVFIKTLTFRTYNGSGDPHPLFADDEYVITAKVRFV